MVWKITGDFTNENLIDYINKLDDRFKVIYKNGILYLMLKSYKKELRFSDLNDYNSRESPDDMIERITKEFKEQIFIPMGDFWIKPLKNWKGEDIFVQNWIGEYLSKIQQEIIEVERQSELVILMNDLDKWEETLKQRQQKLLQEESLKEDKTLKEDKKGELINDE